jgi:hypothetical protein
VWFLLVCILNGTLYLCKHGKILSIPSSNKVVILICWGSQNLCLLRLCNDYKWKFHLKPTNRSEIQRCHRRIWNIHFRKERSVNQKTVTTATQKQWQEVKIIKCEIQVLTEVKISRWSFWVVMPCGLVRQIPTFWRNIQSSALKMTQYVYPKRQYLPTSPHGVTTQKNKAWKLEF